VPGVISIADEISIRTVSAVSVGIP
jgi:hypothetical protein